MDLRLFVLPGFYLKIYKFVKNDWLKRTPIHLHTCTKIVFSFHHIFILFLRRKTKLFNWMLTLQHPFFTIDINVEFVINVKLAWLYQNKIIRIEFKCHLIKFIAVFSSILSNDGVDLMEQLKWHIKVRAAKTLLE